eukprot:9941561-Alexandrium_andersonii.AAC.1
MTKPTASPTLVRRGALARWAAGPRLRCWRTATPATLRTAPDWLRARRSAARRRGRLPLCSPRRTTGRAPPHAPPP